MTYRIAGTNGVVDTITKEIDEEVVIKYNLISAIVTIIKFIFRYDTIIINADDIEYGKI